MFLQKVEKDFADSEQQLSNKQAEIKRYLEVIEKGPSDSQSIDLSCLKEQIQKIEQNKKQISQKCSSIKEKHEKEQREKAEKIKVQETLINLHKSNLASVLEKIKSFDSKIPKNDGVIAELESKIETLQA